MTERVPPSRPDADLPARPIPRRESGGGRSGGSANSVEQPPRSRSNLRTALVMLSIAAVFFFGVIADHLLAQKFGWDKPADSRAAAGARR